MTNLLTFADLKPDIVERICARALDEPGRHKTRLRREGIEPTTTAPPDSAPKGPKNP